MSRSRDLEARLLAIVDTVVPPRHAPQDVQAHLDALTKPQGSLGRLEDLAVRLGTIYGDPPRPFDDVTVYVLAADHGVAARGVSAYPAEVTAQMCANFAAGGAAINVLARACGARVLVVDVGVAADLGHLSGILDRKIRRGTADLSVGPAMSRDEALRALLAGVDLLAPPGVPDLVLVGEMGIGNTTAAAALTAALCRAEPDAVVGPGTGIGQDALERKRAIVCRALERITDVDDPIEVVRHVGGLEIAGAAGAILAAAHAGRAVVIDGFVSTAGALVAAALCPAVRGYAIASHRSPEPGHALALDTLGLRPLLDLEMRLGEASGAALAVPIVRAAGALLREMATFESAGVSGRTPDRAGGEGAHPPARAATREEEP